MGTERKTGGFRINSSKKFRRLFTDDEKYLLQSKEANYVHLNAEIKLKSSCILPVNTLPSDVQIENCGDGGGLTARYRTLYDGREHELIDTTAMNLMATLMSWRRAR